MPWRLLQRSQPPLDRELVVILFRVVRASCFVYAVVLVRVLTFFCVVSPFRIVDLVSR